MSRCQRTILCPSRFTNGRKPIAQQVKLDKVLANQEKILVNQGKIESNQVKLDKVLANQEKILARK